MHEFFQRVAEIWSTSCMAARPIMDQIRSAVPTAAEPLLRNIPNFPYTESGRSCTEHFVYHFPNAFYVTFACVFIAFLFTQDSISTISRRGYHVGSAVLAISLIGDLCSLANNMETQPLSASEKALMNNLSMALIALSAIRIVGVPLSEHRAVRVLWLVTQLFQLLAVDTLFRTVENYHMDYFHKVFALVYVFSPPVPLFWWSEAGKKARRPLPVWLGCVFVGEIVFSYWDTLPFKTLSSSWMPPPYGNGIMSWWSMGWPTMRPHHPLVLNNLRVVEDSALGRTVLEYLSPLSTVIEGMSIFAFSKTLRQTASLLLISLHVGIIVGLPIPWFGLGMIALNLFYLMPVDMPVDVDERHDQVQVASKSSKQSKRSEPAIKSTKQPRKGFFSVYLPFLLPLVVFAGHVPCLLGTDSFNYVTGVVGTSLRHGVYMDDHIDNAASHNHHVLIKVVHTDNSGREETLPIYDGESWSHLRGRHWVARLVSRTYPYDRGTSGSGGTGLILTHLRANPDLLTRGTLKLQRKSAMVPYFWKEMRLEGMIKCRNFIDSGLSFIDAAVIKPVADSNGDLVDVQLDFDAYGGNAQADAHIKDQESQIQVQCSYWADDDSEEDQENYVSNQ